MKELTVEQLKEMADDLSIKWNAANDQGLKELREELGDNLYRCLRAIEERTGDWYRPIQEVREL